MKVLIKHATITDPSSPHHQTQQDILIEDGIVQQIQPSIDHVSGTVIELPGLYISPGWIDIFSNFCDPGFEFKESLETGANAAAAGGFTTVFVLPNTKPVVDNKAQVEYIVQKSKSLPVTIIPIGAITKNTEGRELAEMYDMQNSGAVSFSDGTVPLQSSGIMVKALQYVKSFGGVIIQVPDDTSIVPSGLMNEGIVATRLGLPGKPALAEELIVARDLKLAAYTRSKLHLTAITSSRSLQYIKRAKEEGVQVTCSVTPHHLYFCDEDLVDYDTNLKVNPPFRTRTEMMALREALEDGLIDCIATHHQPHEYDSKTVEFEFARNGMTGLETCYAVLKTIFPYVHEERWTEMLSLHPARIFGLQSRSVNVNQPAHFTLYQPGARSTLTAANTRSRSGNSPFTGKELQGKVAGIINGNTIFLNQ